MRDFNLDDIKELIDDPRTYDPTGDKFIDSRWDEHIAQGGNHLYYRLFYRLATMLKPNFIVELGGWQGTAAAHFASNCPDATVITIDHHTDPGDELNKEKMLKAEDEYDNLHYIQGWTNEYLVVLEYGNHALGNAGNAYSKVLDFGKKIDILFIDSWHQYQEAKMDWDAYQPLLSSPSLVICDDMMLGSEGAGIGGMKQFWEAFPEPKFLDAAAHPGYPIGFVKFG